MREHVHNSGIECNVTILASFRLKGREFFHKSQCLNENNVYYLERVTKRIDHEAEACAEICIKWGKTVGTQIVL